MEVKFLALLQRMYQREKHLERQLVLMTILKQSPPGTLQEAVKNQKIVIELQSWIQSAVEHREFRLAFRVLETLDRLPIDLTVLKVAPHLQIQFLSPFALGNLLYISPGPFQGSAKAYGLNAKNSASLALALWQRRSILVWKMAHAHWNNPNECLGRKLLASAKHSLAIQKQIRALRGS